VARKDPLGAWKAQGIPPEPVGTVDELNAHKMPLRIFPSCAEPTADETVKGCDHWYECTMSYKGLPAAEGGGPRNHCWERIKQAGNGGGITRNVQPCYWGVAQQENVMLNKEVLEPIAGEGEAWEELTTVPDKTSTKNGILGYEKYDTLMIPRVVPEFVRLGKNQKLAQHELRASIIDREQKKARESHNAKVLGVTGAETPLDKRGRGAGQGHKGQG